MSPTDVDVLQTSHEVWVIDTCSILQVRREPSLASRRARTYSAMAAAVKNGSLVFPTEVHGELDRGRGKLSPGSTDEPYEWAAKARDAATRHGTDFDVVKRVLAKVPKVLDAEKPAGADEADPYVLALALRLKEHGHEVTVISEERKDRPDKMSLTTACGLLRLYCVPLMGFLGDQGMI